MKQLQSKTKDTSPSKLLVIGGGPAGLMAAIAAADTSHSVTLYERNDECGQKLLLTANGRCNLTHVADNDELIKHYYDNGRFLWPAITAFSAENLCDFFENLNIPLEIDKFNRVLTQEGDAKGIRDALENVAKKANIHLCTNNRITKLEVCDVGYVVSSSRGIETFDAVIVATGGITYPQTGSTGDGHRFATALGIEIAEPHCALAPLYLEPNWFSNMAGISLDYAEISLTCNNRKKEKHQLGGPLLFTHKGISGPVALNMAHYVTQLPQLATLHLLPHHTAEEVFAVLLSAIKPNRLRKLTSFFPFASLPQNVWRNLLKSQNMEMDQAGTYSHSCLRNLTNLLVATPITIIEKGDKRIGMATAGGVSTKSVSPKTLEAKLRPGLFFCGEVLDIDGESGGYNLQAAFATGHLAGKNALKYLKKLDKAKQTAMFRVVD